MELVYIYDGSFEGIMCCVFDAYLNKERPFISTEEGLQVSFGQQIRRIETSQEKSHRVETGFVKKAGQVALRNAEIVFYSGELNKENAVFRYFFAGFTYGYKIINMLTHPDVLPVTNMYFNVTREVQHLNGFLRFSRMENNVFFARITPKNNALPIMMSHFVDRFSIQPFVIYDAKRDIAGIYNMESWDIVKTQGLHLPEMAEGEEEWLDLWKRFYKSVSIKERESRKRKMNMCPQRFWENMPEMQPDIVYNREERKEIAYNVKLLGG